MTVTRQLRLASDSHVAAIDAAVRGAAGARWWRLGAAGPSSWRLVYRPPWQLAIPITVTYRSTPGGNGELIFQVVSPPFIRADIFGLYNRALRRVRKQVQTSLTTT